ncbi:MAG: hypothetical protein LAO77_24065 [Acidobacteriia bacterium]|nr:hypothetical protein [Terriglobia bacterium]
MALIGLERPSDERRDAERREEFRRDDRGDEFFRRAIVREADPVVVESGDAFERRRALTPAHEIRGTDDVGSPGPPDVRFPHHHEMNVRSGQWA